MAVKVKNSSGGGKEKVALHTILWIARFSSMISVLLVDRELMCMPSARLRSCVHTQRCIREETWREGKGESKSIW